MFEWVPYIYITWAALAALSYFMNFQVVGICLNMWHRRKLTLGNFILCVQAVTDIFVSISMTLIAFELAERKGYFRLVTIFAIDYTQSLSIFTLLGITIERFCAFNIPFIHKIYATRTNIVYGLVLIYLIALPQALIYIFFCYPKIGRMKDFFLTTGILFLVLILFIYLLLIISHRAIRRSINSQEESHSKNTGSKSKRVVERTKKANMKMVVILVVMCSIYALTYLPFTLCRIIGNYHRMDDIVTQRMIEMILTLVYASSAFLNPIITLRCKQDYRKIWNSWFQKKRAPRESQNTGL